MIQLGCNYSKQLIELIEKEKVNIDWIKLAGEEYYEAQYKHVNMIRPILMHFVPRITQTLSKLEYDKYNNFIKECQSPYVAIHLRVEEQDFDNDFTRETLKTKLVEYINDAKENIDVEVLIESMPSYVIPENYKAFADPEFIKELCEEADIDFLLDTGHIKISAWDRNEPVLDYLKKLPLDRVREIHTSGPRFIDGKMIDEHEYMQDDDYKLLKLALSMTNPKIVTLEYGGDGEVFEKKSDIVLLEEQLTKIKNIIKEKN